MSNQLLNHLLAYYNEDPSDPFNIYALATEYKKSNIAEALRLFEFLINQHPTYLPTYYHLAKLYEALADKASAINAYEQGIACATAQLAHHALKELKNAYQELLYDQ